MRETIFLLIALLLCQTNRANTGDSLQHRQPLKYETGIVSVANGIVQLTIPAGYKFLNAGQSQYIVSEVWHTSPQPDLAGLLFPEWEDPFSKNSQALVIKYEPRGYVKDGDANKIDYHQVLRNLQRSEAEDNAERIEMGYAPVHVVGWVQQPVYDETGHVLYWAKEIQVGNKSQPVISYNIRVLGRNGIISANAEGSFNKQALWKNDVHELLHMVSFTPGNRYTDFDPATDRVAAWTIGTLVTGKIVCKTNVFAILAKYLNLILSGLAIVTLLILNLLKHRANSRFSCEMGVARV